MNGEIERRPSRRVSERDAVEVDGERVPPPTGDGGRGADRMGHLHLLMNKPAGCLCERRRRRDPPSREEGDGGRDVGGGRGTDGGAKRRRRDDGDRRRTVYDALPPSAALRPSLSTVGRLDADTTGVLLLTTDGMLGNALANPAFGVSKVYRARLRLREPLPDGVVRRLGEGVRLPHARGAVVRGEARNADGEPPGTVDLRITGGYNRQVKHMLRIVGRPLEALDRLEFAGLRCSETLTVGQTRELSGAEIERLYDLVKGRLDVFRE